MSETTWRQWLDRAKEAFASARRGYRDGLLETGRVLGRYMLARGADQDGVSDRQRRRLGLRREFWVKEAAAELGCRGEKVGHMVQAAALVDLLGPPGELSWAVLNRWLAVLVARKKGYVPTCPADRERALARLAAGRGQPVISYREREVWVVRPGLEGLAPGIYRAAVEGDWGSDRCRDELRRRLPPEVVCKLPGPRGAAPARCRGERPGEGFSGSLVAVASTSTPKDLAELILQMVGASADPQAVKALVEARLRSLLPQLSFAS